MTEQEVVSQEEYDYLMNDHLKQSTQAGEQVDPNSLYTDHMREDKIKNVISQINPDNILEEIENRLSGKRYNKSSQSWERSPGITNPISDKLVANFVSFLGAILNQNTTLSNYSANEINARMEMIIDYVMDDLTDNEDEYGITGNYTEMTRIALIICETCSSVFKRALNGMESRRIFSSLRVNENLTQQPKGGFKDFLKFW